MRKGTVRESELRKILRDHGRFPIGSVSFCEYGLGGDPGLPDSWIDGGAGHWLPLELKRGPSVAKELRPSQRLWHRTSIERGIRTFGATLTTGGVVIGFELGLQMSDRPSIIESELGRADKDAVNLELIQKWLGKPDNIACLARQIKT